MSRQNSPTGIPQDWPIVAFDGEVVLVGEGRTPLGIHERTGRWTMMATLSGDSGRLAVFETAGLCEGWIVFVGERGLHASFPTTAEPTHEFEQDRRGVKSDPFATGGPDLLKAAALLHAGDPTFEAVSRMVSPLRRLRDGDGERPHTFVGTPDSADVVPIYYDALRATSRVNPLVIAPTIRPVIEEQRIAEGLVGGWLPAVRFRYEVDESDVWESVIFASAHGASLFAQPVWYRYLHIVDGGIAEARYVDTYLPYPIGADPDGADFYRALLELDSFWTARLQGGIRLELPDAWIENFSRHSFALEMITRIGDHPKYGVVDRVYAGIEHDGFQDILNASVAAYSEWGLFDVARRYLDYYYENFVFADGRIDYRGPEIGQYARMLTTLARYVTLSGDDSVFRNHLVKVEAIARILLDRRKASLRLDPSNPAYGLIAGRHEADISFDTPTLGTLNYEQPYLSNSAEAARGLGDIADLISLVFDGANESGNARPAIDLAREAKSASVQLVTDLHRAIERSWIVRDGGRELPLIAGADILHRDHPYRSTPYSYDENRAFAELLDSGVLEPQLIDWIVDSAAARGDTAFGIFGNRKLVVSFTAHGVAYGLLQRDRIREFLLLYYAHAAHLHTRGTWTVVECADFDRDRAEHWPYCAPGQLTIPLLTKWMLVFEDNSIDEVWLAKGIPRAWLDDGKRIAVEDAPTRRGPISFEIVSEVTTGRIRAKITISDRFEDSLVLRLRHPTTSPLTGVMVDGQPWEEWDAATETVRIAAPPAGILEIVAHY